jgi:hypothetical protein
MVINVKQIKKLLKTHFKINGSVTVNPDTGVVDVIGDVELKSNLAQMPVQFGHVTGDFWCYGTSLTNLTGAPHEVGGSFYCHYNKLTSLTGAPQSVGGDFACGSNPLTSLMGTPDQIQGVIFLTYAPDLPLLRCLVASKGTQLYNTPSQVRQTLNDPKYMGKGKASALACAAQLVRAGFEGNARW